MTRSAIVTGASVGIGRGIAMRLALDGYRVIALARRGDLLQTLAEEAASLGSLVVPVRADLGTRAGQDAAQAAVRGSGKPVTIVVNNAGGSVPIRRSDAEEAWTAAMTLQFDAVRRLSDAFVPDMQQSGWGRIVNIGAPLEPPNAMKGSTVAKAAMTMWAKIRSSELGAYGITVNTLAPGRIRSEQVLKRLHPSEERRKRFARENIPLGYLGEPSDVAAVVSFLVSPAARYITGELIHVDGGLRRSAW